MRVCFIGGKSFRGEVRTKKSEGGEKMTKFNENLSFSIIKEGVNKDKRTVRVCALAPCVSANQNYYSPKIVESITGKLVGKSSFADHDDRNTKNLIGKIVGESFKEGRQYADIKISSARGIASQTWDKIVDGTIDSVSIAADGKGKPVEMDGQLVNEVTELSVNSVDFVPAGGVPDAKVVRVFENINEIPKLSEVKDKMDLKELREKHPDLVTEIEKPLLDKITEAEGKAQEATDKLLEKEVTTYKETRIAELSLTDKLKDVLRKRVTGKTTDEVSESLKSEVELLKQLGEAFESEAVVKGIVSSDTLNKKPEKEEAVEWTTQAVREHQDIPANLKDEAIVKLHYEGSEAMIKFLKGLNVDIK
jgi:hypothetical protein